MCSLYKSVEELIKICPPVQSYLKNADIFLAHRPRNEYSNVKAETLPEHIELVNCYFVKLINAHHLDNIIDRLIAGYLKENKADEKYGVFIKQLFVNTVVFHDFGKINENFQANKYKMNNPLFQGEEIHDSPISTKHSSLGAFIYLVKHLDEIQQQYMPQEFQILFACCFLFSYSIFKHHSKLLNDNYTDTICFSEDLIGNDINAFKDFLKKYAEQYQFIISNNTKKLIANKVVFEVLNNNKLINSFSLYALIKLNFSLLTASDYLATNEYMNQLPVADFGTLNAERINEIHQYVASNEWLNEVEGKKNYNYDTYQKLDSFVFQNPTEPTGINLNILRQKMAVEVIQNIRKNIYQNLFYIEAPTGGGKTNLSMLATIELLKAHHENLNKVFYVFPFTTLITQTYKSIKETLGLQDDEIIELHSKAGFKEKSNNDDDQYGNEKLNYINNLFINFPFCLLTHIRFFDLLKTNEKENNYLLHRLANSVIVIDELQSYNPQHWDKVIYFIKQYAEKFNIKFILMSATLPKLDKLNVIKEQAVDFIDLIPQAREKYFQNANFSGRVSFNFDLFNKQNFTLQELAEKVIEQSERYALIDNGIAKPLNSVYTIVEFIFKKSASEFFSIIDKMPKFFDEIFVLSGTILEHRRKHIINFLKNKNNRNKKILLITTQVVEAGVDIDMDLGFKDSSLIDSDEQLAGRINRNVNKSGCQLFLFNYNKEAIIYGKDKRLELTRKYINQNAYREILTTKDFDRLYNLVMNDRNEWNTKAMVENFNDYENYIKSLKFQSVQEYFKLIEKENISCFIPINIPVKIEGTTEGSFENVFNDAELNFLSANEIIPNAQKEIEGEKVFDIYLDLIHNKKELIQQKTYEKILQGIMSKFIFTLFANKNIENKIVEYSDLSKSEFGYKYLERWNHFYDTETGMNDAKFNSNETQFL